MDSGLSELLIVLPNVSCSMECSEAWSITGSGLKVKGRPGTWSALVRNPGRNGCLPCAQLHSEKIRSWQDFLQKDNMTGAMDSGRPGHC